MASGDTKTEAMLNVLGNGGTGDEFRGCCNTKTQQYILDAIDRINDISGAVDFVGTDGTADGVHGLVPAPTTADAGKFLKADGTWASASGGSGELGADLIVSNPLGRYAMGDTIQAGTSFETIFRGLLTNVYYPTLTNPSASLAYTLPTYAKVKSTISAATATLTLNRGSINPQYTATSPYRSGAATNYAIATSGADTEYSDSSTSSGTFNVNALTRSTKGDITITGTVSYAAGVQPKDSDGNNYSSPLPAGSVTATKKVTFIQPFYWGISNNATISDFTGLTESVTAKGTKNVPYTTNNQYMVFCYDSAYGNLSSILDPNSFETISGWNQSTLTVDGFTYKVYVSSSPTTDTNAQFTFIF